MPPSDWPLGPLPSDRSLSDRVSASIEQLSLVATDLNKASDELGKAISAIDAVLQNLNIGVPTWVKIHSGEDPYYGLEYWSRDVGYAKIDKRWGIALRTREGNYNNPDEEQCESWLFNDAPRWLRVEGIEKIPDLLDALVKNTEETTKKIRAKTAEANNLAVAIAQAAGKNTVPKAAPPTQSSVGAMMAEAAGPTPLEKVAEVAIKTALQLPPNQQRLRDRIRYEVAVKAAAKELDKGKK
jgi:hypothetical protein